MPDGCSHLEKAAKRTTPATPSGHGCKECLASGGDWVHLRLCLECGHVGCCDNSPSRHATKHFHKTHHAVIRSFEPGELWAYCFTDETFLEALPPLAGEVASQHYDAPGA